MAKRDQTKKLLQEQADADFLLKKDTYEKLCFDTESVFYQKMIDILDSAKDKELSHEAGYELHHRIPRSFFKKMNLLVVDKENLYKLTYSQHFMVHYYAYMCATKFMKAAMSLALLEMKRVCTKVDGCTEEDAENLSELFGRIKNELYYSLKKDYREKSLSFWKKKYEKTKFLVTDILRQDQANFAVEFMCKDCGAKFKRYPYNWSGKRCPYCLNSTGYRESVDLLWFAIDLRTDKAVWYTTHVSYTPSSRRANAIIDIKRLQTKLAEDYPEGFRKYLYRARVVDVKPENFNWNLPESRKYSYHTTQNFLSCTDGVPSFSIKDSSSRNQARKLVAEKKGYIVPFYLLNYFFEEYKNDPAFLDRVKYALDKMCEINHNLSFR